MTILDEYGDEHEAAVGMLVETSEGSLARIVALSGSFADLYQLGAWFGQRNISSLILISTSPAPQAKWEVGYRRNSLIENLMKARNACSKSDWGYIDSIFWFVSKPYNLGKENAWFWESVAESADDPRKISYATEKRLVDNDRYRKRCSVAKFLKGPARSFGLNTSDEEADRIAFLVGQHFPITNTYLFEILSGAEAVEAAYHSPEAENWGSCMWGKKYPDWYAENPDSVSVLKILRGGNFVGRALLWKAEDGTTVLDRIYPSDDQGAHTRAAHEHARENGWEYKTSQSMKDGSLTSGDKDLIVRMKPSQSGLYPYLDTFKYTEDDPSSSRTIRLSIFSRVFSFVDTCGAYVGGVEELYCSSCDNVVSEEDAEYYDGVAYCEECFLNHFVHLDYPLPGGGHEEGVFRRDETDECDNCALRRRGRDLHSVNCNGRERDWCSECVEDDATSCEQCGEMHAIEHSVQVDGLCFCSSDCAESAAEPVTAATVGVTPAPVTPGFIYPPAGYDYYHSCTWRVGENAKDYCAELRKRREMTFPHPLLDPGPQLDDALHFHRCWIEAPYPNVLEQEAIDRQEAVTVGGEALASLRATVDRQADPPPNSPFPCDL